MGFPALFCVENASELRRVFRKVEQAVGAWNPVRQSSGLNWPGLEFLILRSQLMGK